MADVIREDIVTIRFEVEEDPFAEIRRAASRMVAGVADMVKTAQNQMVGLGRSAVMTDRGLKVMVGTMDIAEQGLGGFELATPLQEAEQGIQGVMTSLGGVAGIRFEGLTTGIREVAAESKAVGRTASGMVQNVAALAGEMADLRETADIKLETPDMASFTARAMDAGRKTAAGFASGFKSAVNLHLPAVYQNVLVDSLVRLRPIAEGAALAVGKAGASLGAFGTKAAAGAAAVGAMNYGAAQAGQRMAALDAVVLTTVLNMALNFTTLRFKMGETQTAMSTEMTTITTNMQTMATDVLTALNGLAEPLYTAGVDAMAGFNNGLESQRETVLATAASIASAAAASMCGALEIHSPSRVVQEIGVYTGQGLPLGMESQRGAVQREAQALALAALPPVVPSPPVAPAVLPQQGLPPMVPFMLPPRQAEAGPPLLAPRTPETAPVTARGGNTYNQNQYSPQFSLTIGGGATAQNRETERQVRTWIREEFGKMLRAAGRGAPAAREV